MLWEGTKPKKESFWLYCSVNKVNIYQIYMYIVCPILNNFVIYGLYEFVSIIQQFGVALFQITVITKWFWGSLGIRYKHVLLYKTILLLENIIRTACQMTFIKIPFHIITGPWTTKSTQHSWKSAIINKLIGPVNFSSPMSHLTLNIYVI